MEATTAQTPFSEGNKLMEGLQKTGVISSEAKNFLIEALDPFHDVEIENPEGWPDNCTGKSVIRRIPMSMSLSRPPTVLAGNPWDCHIIQWPWLNGSYKPFYSSVARRGNSLLLADTLPLVVQSANVGGLQAYGMAAGTGLNILQTGTCVQIGRLDIDPALTRGSGRLIGMGFECHNTTPALTKGGSLCVYRQPMPAQTPSVFTASMPQTAPVAQTSHLAFESQLLAYPPLLLSEAIMLPGSRQWEAAKGCYCVAAFESSDNPAMSISPGIPVIQAASAIDVEGINTSGVNLPAPDTAQNAGGTASMPSIRIHPVHQSGVIMSGLSSETTLTINWMVYYQQFPTENDVNIINLARTSCKNDYNALAILSESVNRLPVGVEVWENGIGEWFLEAAHAASKVLIPAISSIPHPIAQGAAALLKYINETTTTKKKDKPKRKKVVDVRASNGWYEVDEKPYARGLPKARPRRQLEFNKPVKEVVREQVRGRNMDRRGGNALASRKRKK